MEYIEFDPKITTKQLIDNIYKNIAHVAVQDDNLYGWKCAISYEDIKDIALNTDIRGNIKNRREELSDIAVQNLNAFQHSNDGMLIDTCYQTTQQLFDAGVIDYQAGPLHRALSYVAENMVLWHKHLLRDHRIFLSGFKNILNKHKNWQFSGNYRFTTTFDPEQGVVDTYNFRICRPTRRNCGELFNDRTLKVHVEESSKYDGFNEAQYTISVHRPSITKETFKTLFEIANSDL